MDDGGLAVLRARGVAGRHRRGAGAGLRLFPIDVTSSLPATMVTPSKKAVKAKPSTGDRPARTPAATRPAKVAKPVTAARPKVSFRMRITTGDSIAIGPGKIALLEALDDTGSITSAAKSLDMSYRRAWLLMSELNAALKQPAVESLTGGVAGGGSRLTAVGKSLVTRYRRVERTAAEACAADLKELVKLVAG
jgi:molybdate transport system regulatory protein